jgi:hypothetical protein
MESIVVHTKKQASVPVRKAEGEIEYTEKGNKLYRFSIVSKEELEKLRVPVYRYIL